MRFKTYFAIFELEAQYAWSSKSRRLYRNSLNKSRGVYSWRFQSLPGVKSRPATIQDRLSRQAFIQENTVFELSISEKRLKFIGHLRHYVIVRICYHSIGPGPQDPATFPDPSLKTTTIIQVWIYSTVWVFTRPLWSAGFYTRQAFIQENTLPDTPVLRSVTVLSITRIFLEKKGRNICAAVKSNEFPVHEIAEFLQVHTPVCKHSKSLRPVSGTKTKATRWIGSVVTSGVILFRGGGAVPR